MKKISFIIFINFSIVFNSLAQNPIVPPGVYIADPSAHIWDDGKLYVYGSLDESTDYYCSFKYHVLATSDLKTWELFEDRFASKGQNDQVPESDQLLFAPDCQFKNGKYYLYYCLPDREFTEGVAISSSPTGPFTYGRNIQLYGYNQIDPCVFIDDDGQAYYVWGQFTMKMARLKASMTELDESTIKDSVLTEAEHFFHEGAFMTRRNGIYYLVYADLSRANTPTCLGYATSEQPTGPYQYRGVIIDNDRCDPANWNNHGSIAEFGGQWYVFYHRATHGSRMMRKACIEPITFNPDGSITEVEMTSQGAGPPLDALSQIDAERVCLLFGNGRIRAFSSDNEELGGIRDKDRVAFKYIDFGDGVDKVTFRVKPGKKSGKIDLALDMPWHQSIGTVEINGDDYGTWQNIIVDIKSVTGVHALWLRFSGDGDDLFSIDWFRFSPQ